MKIIKGDLVLTEDIFFYESITVEGNILGKDGKRFDLKVDGDLNCRNLNCLDLNCRNLNCRNLNCWDLNCRNLNCRDLDCWDLNCRDLDCWDLNCWDLNCRNLNCLDLNCRNLNCFNLNFYAVAFAYESFKCKSVEGRRENSRYFCLDSEVIIDE